jgi:hypothetical protein
MNHEVEKEQSEIVPWHLQGGTKEIYEKCQSEVPVSRLIFEWHTSRVQGGSIFNFFFYGYWM